MQLSNTSSICLIFVGKRSLTERRFWWWSLKNKSKARDKWFSSTYKIKSPFIKDVWPSFMTYVIWTSEHIMVNLEENQFLEQMDLAMPLGFSRMRPGLILCLAGSDGARGCGKDNEAHRYHKWLVYVRGLMVVEGEFRILDNESDLQGGFQCTLVCGSLREYWFRAILRSVSRVFYDG